MAALKEWSLRPAVPGPFRGRSGSGHPDSRAAVSPVYPRAAASRRARAPAPSAAPRVAIGRRACHSSNRDVYGSAVTPRWGLGGGFWLCAVVGEPEVTGSSPALAPSRRLIRKSQATLWWLNCLCLSSVNSREKPACGVQHLPSGAGRALRCSEALPATAAPWAAREQRRRVCEGAAVSHLEKSGLGALWFATAA